MKLGTLKTQSWGDGELVVVSKDNSKFVRVPQVAKSLREAIETWPTSKEKLQNIYVNLNKGEVKEAEEVNEALFHSPLPRSFQWADGSAFLHHVK